jgi:nucleoside-diphosphate-sugar epimerase
MHVVDVADAFVALLDSPIQGAVNIGSGKGVALKDIIQIITRFLGNQELVQFGTLSAQPNDPAQLVANVERLHSELNWSPTHDLEEGIKQVIAWWKTNFEA